jgi:nitric oxide reductase NorE protein
MSKAERRVPGEAGIWVLILGELFIFSIFFVTLAAGWRGDRSAFAEAQATLNLHLGLLNTMLLLTSSLFVALAVHRSRDAQPDAARMLYAAIACGLGFVAVKTAEYAEKISAGVNFETGEFFTLYFAFTGIHLAHVLIGLVALAIMSVMMRRPQAAVNTALIECGGIFWHLVDLLWIILFALFYLVR